MFIRKIILILLVLCVNLINILSSNYKPIFNKLINNTPNLNDIKTYIDISLVMKILQKDFPQCYQDLEDRNPKNYGMPIDSKYPSLLDQIGKSFNDLGDEIECLNSIYNTSYLIVEIEIVGFVNKDDEKLIGFLEKNHVSVGGCTTPNCIEPLTRLANIFQGFTLNNEGIKKKEIADMTMDIDSDENEAYIFVIAIYMLIKLIVGVISLIYIPKGYESKAMEIKNNKSNNKSYQLFFLRIIRFLDFFNDLKYISSNKNRYYNDTDLQHINCMKVISLFFFIFCNTFNTLLALPSKDILNKEFFSSKSLFIYRFSTYSIIAWIFLEGASTTYKLMIYIKKQKSENNNKNSYINLLIAYAKFLLSLLPKIIMFLIYYLFLYTGIQKFKYWFKAKTTYKYISEKYIINNIYCHNHTSAIFTNFINFTNNVDDFKSCYEFTFVYNNILFCIIISMILLFIFFICKKIIIEISIMVINFVLFFFLMFIIKDIKTESSVPKFKYYHFQGQEYTTKFPYLTLGVYQLGFILGILNFNYDNIKNEWKNKKTINKKTTLQNKLNSSNEMAKINDNSSMSSGSKSQKTNNSKNSLRISINKNYYPLIFLDGFLKWINDIKYRNKIIVILLCISLQLLLSALPKIYGFINLDKEKINEDPIYKRDYFLDMEFDTFLRLYFYLEKHIFLILFFIMNLILITLPKKGFYRQLIKMKIVTAISRCGFIIICVTYIMTFLSFIGFLVKIKFNIITFFLISIGNFLIIFALCIMFNIIFGIPLRIIVKKILRINKKEKNEIGGDGLKEGLLPHERYMQK